MSETSEAIAEATTLDQRAAIIHDAIRSEASQSAAEPVGADAPGADRQELGTAQPPAEAAPKAGSAADSEAKTPADERKARLKALAEAEQAKVAKAQRRAEQDRLTRELEETRRRAEDAEARAAKAVDIGSLDEASFFRLAQEKGIRPDRLGEWIRDSMVNPERIAEAAAAEAARKAVDPKVSDLEKKLAALEARLAEEQSTRAALHEREAEIRAAHELMEITKTQAEHSPLSARYLDKRGPDAFYALASAAAQMLPPGSGFQAVLDQIEENLNAFRDVYVSDTTSKPSAAPTKKTAAAKANTVSAQLAQERASVVDEEDWASLSLEERAARMKSR